MLPPLCGVESNTLKINKKAITEEKFVKYLGVLINMSLNWKAHILNISKKILTLTP